MLALALLLLTILRGRGGVVSGTGPLASRSNDLSVDARLDG
jgi:hypothetical protein